MVEKKTEKDISKMLIESELDIREKFYAAAHFSSKIAMNIQQEDCRTRALLHNLLVKELKYDQRYYVSLPGM